MNWKILHQRAWLNLIGAVILVVGLSSAVLIHQRAGHDRYGAWGYDVADGEIYPIMPENSKLYRHNLEVYGGKFAVIMDDFRRWFLGLGQGRSLAFMLAGITIIISLGFFYKANYSTRPLKSEVPQDHNPEGTG